MESSNLLKSWVSQGEFEQCFLVCSGFTAWYGVSLYSLGEALLRNRTVLCNLLPLPIKMQQYKQDNQICDNLIITLPRRLPYRNPVMEPIVC